jgi:nucleoside-diphosphate-sugar epimerase
VVELEGLCDVTVPPRSESDLDDLLSRPTGADVSAMAQLVGDILVLGAGGKMGPSLVRLARRASEKGGASRRIVAVSRFQTPGVAEALATDGVEPIVCDLLDPDSLTALPDLSNVIFMVGQKFGTTGDPAATWALNAFLPGVVARRFSTSNLVVFSTGNVYPLIATGGSGPSETDPTGPIGEYAQSALARERVMAFFSTTQQTPTAILRLNYAVELRYGVLRDLADRIWHREPIDLTMGYVNVIWQRDANSVALRALAHCTVPPLVLNLTGTEKLSVRELAFGLGKRLGVDPIFSGQEASTALLSDASRCEKLFGPPSVSVETVLDWVADWVQGRGRSLGKPTHFEEREGRF